MKKIVTIKKIAQLIINKNKVLKEKKCFKIKKTVYLPFYYRY